MGVLALVKVNVWRLMLLGGVLSLGASAGDPPPVVKTQGFLPFADAPIHYRTSKTLGDQITQLNRQLESGEAQLTYEPEFGYLRSVLQNLGIPASSQTLVFSKTSLQFQHISPSHPRALYFNDNVYVGQVKNSKSLELIAFDATQGAVFYVLGEQKVDAPRFERAQLDCVQCHIAAATHGIPGVIVRSVLTTASGAPKGGAPVRTMGHETPFAERWGGWFVTGAPSPQSHLGNLKSDARPDAFGRNLTDLSGFIDTSKYLSPESDLVAHLVLAHQTQMHNLVTETNYRYRLGAYADAKKQPDAAVLSEQTVAQYQRAAEATLRYLLFTNEAPLPAPIGTGSRFATEFAALGPRDHLGRSLRDFDLRQRIFKYPCSYLIYSDAFDAIPGPAREYLLKRLFDVLTGSDQSADFAALTAEDRRAILEILVDTKPGLPRQWSEFLQQHPVSQRSTPGIASARSQR